MLIDEGPQLAGTLDVNLVQSLYNRGLAYIDVPVYDGDFIFGRVFNVLVFFSSFPAFIKVILEIDRLRL